MSVNFYVLLRETNQCPRIPRFGPQQYVSAVTDKVDRPEKAICEESGGRFTRQHSKMQELSYIADRLGCSCNQLTIGTCAY